MLAKLKPRSFEEVNTYIIENERKLNQEDAINIMIYSYNICIQCSEELGSIYLESALNKAYSLISNLNETQLLQYIQTIYHIAKCLTDKVSIF